VDFKRVADEKANVWFKPACLMVKSVGASTNILLWLKPSNPD
jgi:hypothetical protein